MVGERKVQRIGNPTQYIPQTYLVKFSFTGDILWQKTYGDSLYGNFAVQGAEDPWGNIYVPYNKDSVVLMKVDNLGNVLWQKSYSEPINEWDDVHLTSDNKFLIINGSNLDSVFLFAPSVSKLDTSGNLIWNKTYTDSLIYSNSYAYITQDTYYLGGRLSSGGSKAVILKIDADGNLIWKRVFTNGFETVYSMAQNSSSTFIASGNYFSQSQNYGSGYCVKFDSAGNIIWQKNYYSDTVYGFNSITKNVNGYYGLVEPGDYGKTKVMVIDSNGALLTKKTHYYQPQNLIGYYHINNSNDSGFIISGFFSPSIGPIDCIVVKTDKFGNTTPIGIINNSNFTSEYELKVFTYPNPFNSTLNIRIDLYKGNEISINVYDILGKELTIITNKYYPAGVYKILFSPDKYNLSSGIYFIKVSSVNQSIFKKIIYIK
jgi:hypothetical protein